MKELIEKYIKTETTTTGDIALPPDKASVPKKKKKEKKEKKGKLLFGQEKPKGGSS